MYEWEVERNQCLIASTSAPGPGIHIAACSLGPGAAWRGTSQPGSLLDGLSGGQSVSEVPESTAAATVEVAAGGR
jgi:hypothetical protein